MEKEGLGLAKASENRSRTGSSELTDHDEVTTVTLEEPVVPSYEDRPLNWLWCQLRPSGSKRDLNQWRHVAVCKKIECHYLTEENKVFDCHCPTSLQYLGGLRKMTQEEINKVRAERKAGHRIDDEEEDDLSC